jgi:PHD/YefM family antitoxin component YafN of YafNO toxin-antitoxin module
MSGEHARLGRWRWCLAIVNFFSYNAHVKLGNSEPEIITRNGKPVSVILPIKKYQEMIERLEDAEDVAWLKKARKKPLHYRRLKEYLVDRKARV